MNRAIPPLLVVALLLVAPAWTKGEGSAWTTLGNVARAYELLPPVADARRVILRRRFDTVYFEEGSRKMQFNGVKFYLNSSVIRQGDDWLITLPDVDRGLGPLLCPAGALLGAETRLVMLDPGHGGSDPGTKQAGLEEKELTLDIARRVRAKLRACQVDAGLSRERDVAVSLSERCRKAERAGASLFLSIHINASRDRRTSGIETFIIPSPGYAPTGEHERAVLKREGTVYPANRHDAANTVLAFYVHKGLLASSGAEDRGVRRARFQVIRGVPCPAALVECGFLSNRQESDKFAQEWYRDMLAEGLSRGILTYLSRAREARLPAPVEL